MSCWSCTTILYVCTFIITFVIIRFVIYIDFISISISSGSITDQIENEGEIYEVKKPY